MKAILKIRNSNLIDPSSFWWVLDAEIHFLSNAYMQNNFLLAILVLVFSAMNNPGNHDTYFKFFVIFAIFFPQFRSSRYNLLHEIHKKTVAKSYIQHSKWPVSISQDHHLLWDRNTILWQFSCEFFILSMISHWY